MPNYIVVQIATELSIADINGQQCQATKQYESLNGLIDYLSGLAGGAKSGTVTIVSKDATTSISTSGTGSQSLTFTY